MNTALKLRAVRHPLAPVLAVLAVVLALVAVTAPGARAANGLDSAAQALRDGPVYVDPRASDTLSDAQADEVAQTIKAADKPIFVAVLPDASEYDPSTLFRDLRAEVGLTGVYAVALGDRFAARADSSVMSRAEVTDLAAAAERSHSGDMAATVDSFVEQAARQAGGDAPASWSGAAGAPDARGSPASFLAGVGVLVGMLALVGCGALLVGRMGAKRRAQEEREQLETLRPVVDEDITAFGEELDRLDFSPSESAADDAMREDYSHALDSYESAKRAMAAARRPGDVRGVTRALEDGRFALATLDARRTGKPLPDRRPPCFFDPRHGPSVTDVRWTPRGGEEERTVPVCAADATRIADGEEPMGRQVQTPSGRRPYWEAGPAYAPWAYGYFGGGLLPGLLMGTMLGSMMVGPHAYGGEGFAEGGGDAGGFGGDFGGGFGGGFGDFGGGF